MFWDLLSSRWFQAGFAFFVLVVGGSLLYGWHVQRTTEYEFGKRPQPGVSIENKPPTNTAPIDFQTDGLLNTPDETTDTPMETDETEALSKETEFADIADAFLPDDMVSEEAPTEDVPVSPFGFGPYPEVPEDYPYPVDWQKRSKDGELLTRVLIKVWNNGNRHSGGSFHTAVSGERVILPHYHKAIYVKWKEKKRQDGTVHRYPAVMTSGGLGPGVYAEIHETMEILSYLKVLNHDLDGIEPYNFLDLQHLK